MRGWKGLLTAALVLVTLQTVVQRRAANRVGGLADLAGEAARRFLDPGVPAIGPKDPLSVPASSGAGGDTATPSSGGATYPPATQPPLVLA